MLTGHLSSGLSIQGCHIVHGQGLAQQILAREEASQGAITTRDHPMNPCAISVL
jgi:hypothetical protein